MKNSCIFLVLLLSAFMSVWAQKTNYDESKIEDYTLPDPLIFQNGKVVKNIKQWENKRKAELLNIFTDQIYGRIPGELNYASAQIIEQGDDALEGMAHRKQVLLKFEKDGKTVEFNILIYTPKGIENPPIFLGYNFMGNQTVIDDPKVVLNKAWIATNVKMGFPTNSATEESRGKRASAWPIRELIAEGFGVATAYPGEIDADNKLDFSDGVMPFFYKDGQTMPTDGEWRSMAVWAWGLSKIKDYFNTDPELKKAKTILMGMSRFGKVALWAGASDPRFDMVISCVSGSGGAALYRRKIGETMYNINTGNPHWFSGNYHKIAEEKNLPIDQHELLALIAPRPLYVSSAEEDHWADQKGEFLSLVQANPVYQLYGKKGLPATDMPKINEPIQGYNAYHIRSGKHGITLYDWEQYMSFAKKHLK